MSYTIPVPDGIDEAIERAVHATCAEADIRSGSVGVRLVSDAEIQAINRQSLGHDYVTDVISWGYSDDRQAVEGDVVVSYETACRMAVRIGWDPLHELLLYVVHGTLHCIGMEDTDPAERAEMREAEGRVFQRLGIAPPPRGPDEKGGEAC